MNASRAKALDTVPMHQLREGALRELVGHQEMLTLFDGTAFMSSEISYTIFTAMREMRESGKPVTFYSLLRELLGYTVTVFDELDLIVARDTTYAAVNRIFTARPHGEAICCEALTRRCNEIEEAQYAA